MHLRLPGWFELSHVFINIMYLLSLSRVSWNIELNHHRAHIEILIKGLEGTPKLYTTQSLPLDFVMSLGK